jgi:heme/copper-type cytochrome/quinol oxidase subunit 2
MADMDLKISSIVSILTVVLIVAGLVISFFFYFKRAETLTDEDRLNIERVKIAWIGAVALGVLTLVSARREKSMGSVSVRSGSASRGASLL